MEHIIAIECPSCFYINRFKIAHSELIQTDRRVLECSRRSCREMFVVEVKMQLITKVWETSEILGKVEITDG